MWNKFKNNLLRCKFHKIVIGIFILKSLMVTKNELLI